MATQLDDEDAMPHRASRYTVTAFHWSLTSLLSDLRLLLRQSALRGWHSNCLMMFALCGQIGCAVLSFYSQYSTAGIIGSVLDGDREGTVKAIIAAFSTYAALAILQMLVAFAGEHLRLRSRAGLMRSAHSLYFTSTVPHRLTCGSGVAAEKSRTASSSSAVASGSWLSSVLHRCGLAALVTGSGTPDHTSSVGPASIGYAYGQGSPLNNPDQQQSTSLLASDDHAAAAAGAAPSASSTAPTMAAGTNGIDTIDQRLTSDVDTFSRELCGLIFGSYLYPSSAVASIASLVITLVMVAAEVSALVIPFALVLFVASALVTTFLAAAVSRTFYESDQQFGRLRYLHAYIGLWFEEISFLRGTTAETSVARHRLRQYQASTLWLYLWSWLQSTWSSFISQFPYLLSYFIIIFLLWIGGNDDDSMNLIGSDDDGGGGSGDAVDPTKLSQAVSIIGQFLAAATTLPSVWSNVASLAGYAARVAEVMQAAEIESSAVTGRNAAGSDVNDAHNSSAGAAVAASSQQDNDGPDRPSSSPAPSQLTVNISGTAVDIPLVPGQHVLVLAPSGSGKTTALRLLAGLTRPNSYPGFSGGGSASSASVLESLAASFVPQRAYLPIGSVQQSLCLDHLSGAAPTGARGTSDSASADGDDAGRLMLLMDALNVACNAHAGVMQCCEELASSSNSASNGICSANDWKRFHAALIADPANVKSLVSLPRPRNLETIAGGGVAESVAASITAVLNQLGLQHVVGNVDRLPNRSPSLPHHSATALDDSGGRGSDTTVAFASAGKDWMGILSGGEQHRMMAARLLLSNHHFYEQRMGMHDAGYGDGGAAAVSDTKRFVFLDEATSALDLESEERLMTALMTAGYTLISFGHRRSLTRFHDVILDLTGEASGEDQWQQQSGFNGSNASSSAAAAFASAAVDHRDPRTIELQSAAAAMDSASQSSEATVHSASSPPSSIASAATRSAPPSVFRWLDLWRVIAVALPRLNLPCFSRLQSRRNSVVSRTKATMGTNQLHPSSPAVTTRLLELLNHDSDTGVMILLLAALVACGSLSWITVRVAYIPGWIFQSILDGDSKSALEYCLAGLVVYICSAALGAGSRAIGQVLSLAWYCRLVDWMDERYLAPATIQSGTPASNTSTAGDSGDGDGCASGRGGDAGCVGLSWTAPPLYALSTRNLSPATAPNSGASSSQQTHASSIRSSQRLDRIDQRIVGDTYSLTYFLGQIIFGGDGRLSIIQVLATIAATTITASKYGPTPVLCCYGYTLAGLLICKYLSRPLPRATMLVNTCEGMLRAVHARVRAYAEEIGFLRLESHEKHSADSIFGALVAASASAIHVQFLLRISNNIFAYVGTVAAFAITAIIATATGSLGAYPADAANLYALAYLLTSLNLYLCALPDFGANAALVGGYLSRVGALVEVLMPLDTQSNGADTNVVVRDLPSAAGAVTVVSKQASSSTFPVDEVVALEVGPVAAAAYAAGSEPLTTAGGRSGTSKGFPLHAPVSFSVQRGEVIRISGKSGVGKTSLLRTLAGLRQPAVIAGCNSPAMRLVQNNSNTTGDSPLLPSAAATTSSRNERSQQQQLVMFLPQRAFVLLGCTIADNVRYPSPPSDLRLTSVVSGIVGYSSVRQMLFDLLPAFVTSRLGARKSRRGDYAPVVTTSSSSSSSSSAAAASASNPPSALISIDAGEEAQGSADDRIRDALQSAGLHATLLQRHGPDYLHSPSIEWHRIMSGGERQRLSLARVFYHRPAFVIMDEGLSSLPGFEGHKLLVELQGVNVGVVMVSHDHA